MNSTHRMQKSHCIAMRVSIKSQHIGLLITSVQLGTHIKRAAYFAEVLSNSMLGSTTGTLSSE